MICLLIAFVKNIKCHVPLKIFPSTETGLFRENDKETKSKKSKSPTQTNKKQIPNKTSMFPVNCDREIVMEAVKKYGPDLEYASDELKADREIVMEAVKDIGLSLEYASLELRGDWEIVLEAVKQDFLSLEYASDELRADREFIMEAMKQNECALEFASPELQDELDYVELQADRGIVHFASAMKREREPLMGLENVLKKQRHQY